VWMARSVLAVDLELAASPLGATCAGELRILGLAALQLGFAWLLDVVSGTWLRSFACDFC